MKKMDFDEFVGKIDNPDGLSQVQVNGIDDISNNISNAVNQSNIKLMKSIDELKSVMVELFGKEKSIDFSPITSLIYELRNHKPGKQKTYNDKFLIEKLDNVVAELKKQKPTVIREVKEDKKGIDLLQYRVCDVYEPVTGYQYFGFIKEDGGWYILYNDATEGKVRYKFGTSNYQESWNNCTELDYKLIDEALNEIKD